jgi:EndoU nuclease-like protein
MIGIRNVLAGLMALDRPDDDFDRPERRVPGSDVPARRPEPAESRSHEEYYEALRAASDGGTADGGCGAGDADRSGWDSVDAEDRPKAEDIRVTPERTTHILDGDADGSGGHRHGTGIPGKTEFPASWDDKKIIDSAVDVARRPDLPPKHQEWNDRWVARGTRDDVEVVVVVARDGQIRTSWPTPDSPGVVKNPKEP